MGHRITFYERDVEYYSSRRDFRDCDFCELVLHGGWNQVRSRALVDASDSDVVIVGSYCPEGARISDEVLGLARPLHVFYDLDTPITLSNLQSGTLDYLRLEQMSSFDLYLSFTGGRILDELEQRWNVRRARALYGCVDPELHARVEARPEFTCDLSYMGTYAADRQKKVDDLFVETARRMPSSQFVLAGSLYPWQWSWPANVRRFDHVPPSEHPALYSSSRATLNLTRAGMARTGYCPSGRFFEAAACGTAIVTDWFEGLESFFADDEVLVIDTPEGVVRTLNMTNQELEKVARRSRERTLDEHTGERRAHELLRYLEEARWARSRERIIRKDRLAGALEIVS
jgi:spore maturation protein CgeB